MPHNPVSEIERIMAEVVTKCQALATRELSSPEDVRRLEMDAASIGRELSDRLSEAIIATNVERLDRDGTRDPRPAGLGTATSMGMRSTSFRLLGGLLRQ